LVEIAGVRGAPMPLRAMCEAAGIPADRSERATASARNAHLIRVRERSGRRWLLPYNRHVRETILGLLDAEEQRRHHEHIARALEARDEANREDLAAHWAAAGHPQRARRHLIAAAQAAEDKLAFDHAASLYGAALDQGDDDRLELMEARGRALMLAGRSFEAAGVFEEAAGLATEHHALDLERMAADNLLRSGHIERGLQLMGSVLQRLGAPFAPTRARAALSLIWHRARLAVRGHGYAIRPSSEIDERSLLRLDTLYAAAASLGMIDHIRGAAAQTRHLLDALELGDERRICRALAIECAYLTAPGGKSARRALELGAQVMETATRLDDPYLAGIAQLSLGGGAYFAGDPVPAVKALSLCDELFDQAGRSVQWERVTARYFLVLAQLATGDYSAAGATTDRSLREAEHNHDEYARAMFQCIPRTWSLLIEDRPEEATASLERALQGWPDSTFYIAHYVQMFSRTLVAIYRGDGEAAAHEIEGAMPDVRRLLLTRMPWVMSEINTLRCRAALLVGDEQRARKAIRYLSRSPIDYNHGVAALLQGSLLSDDPDRATRELEHAATLLDESGAAHLAAAARNRWAQLAGDEEAVAASLEELAPHGPAAPQRLMDALCPPMKRG
jgi:tetratricopeptide (TPR) repeat protein